MSKRVEEHAFSIEMKSEQGVRKMSLFNKDNGHFFFEGFLGQLKNVSMIEGVMLVIGGLNGVLKLDITQDEVKKCLSRNKPNCNGSELR